MRIKLDENFVLASDERCWMILETKTKKNSGEEYDTPVSYHLTLEQAIVSLSERLIRRSSASKIKDAVEDVNAVKMKIQKLYEATEEIRHATTMTFPPQD